MNKGIENKSVDFKTVDTIEEAVENAGFNSQQLLGLFMLFGNNGIDELVKVGVEELSNKLGDNWPTEDVCRLKRRLYPGLWPQTNKE